MRYQLLAERSALEVYAPAANHNNLLLCRWSADVGSLVGLESSGSGGSLPLGSMASVAVPAVASGSAPAVSAPSPLRLPLRYEEAKEHKVQSVANLRTAVKSVRACLQCQEPLMLAERTHSPLGVIVVTSNVCTVRVPPFTSVKRPREVTLAITWLCRTLMLSQPATRCGAGGVG